MQYIAYNYNIYAVEVIMKNKKIFLIQKTTQQNKSGFTLAEVLIVIAIIGIVAAIILPTLNKDIKDKQYEVARKKLLITLGESLKQISVQGEMKDASDTKDFVENSLKKRIKIIKTCENDSLRGCGLETGTNKILTLSEIKTTMPKQIGDLGSDIRNTQYLSTNSKSYGFVTADGVSVNLFYNPNCRTDIKETAHNSFDMICANAIYDMNGLSGPNQFGKDIGIISVLYPDNETVAVAPNAYQTGNSMTTFDKFSEVCNKLGSDYTVPDRNELAALVFNGNYTGVTAGAWGSGTSDEHNINNFWIQNGSSRSTVSKTSGRPHIRCIKR